MLRYEDAGRLAFGGAFDQFDRELRHASACAADSVHPASPSWVPPEHERKPVIECQHFFWMLTLDLFDAALKLSVVELG